MTRPNVSIRVPVGRPLPDIAAFAARCEDAGFDGVGIHDHPSSGRDAYLALALAGNATRNLELFPATSSPSVRHPLLLGALANSMSEIAPGRSFLTLAPGFISNRSMGRPQSGLAVMREAMAELRTLLAGDEVAYGPRPTCLRNRTEPSSPIHVLAAGPRMIELAGELADGAFLKVGLHPDGIRAARRHLEIGAARAGRSLDDFPVTYIVTFGLGADASVGAQWVRSWFDKGQPFLCYPNAMNLRWLGEAGFAIEKDHDPTAIPEDEAARIADAFGLFGPPERCAERLIQAQEELGAERFFLFPAHDLEGGYAIPEPEVDAFERVIRPRLE
jgi:5,10-methylenetetrahydromethanopterin reductase